MKEKIRLFINRFLHLFEVRRIKTTGKVVYLTFDDGPEEGITEFVLNQLKRYNFKATFFCKGENAEKHPELFSCIVKEGHAIGNHTYSHINGFENRCLDYVADVEKANQVLNTHFFRPPWGAVRLCQFIKLRRKYKIVYWSLLSGDTLLDNLNVENNFNRLKRVTRKGDVVLFHFCKRHEKETQIILPAYLDWLNENGFISLGIN